MRVRAPLFGSDARLKTMPGRIALLERFARKKVERVVPRHAVVLPGRLNAVANPSRSFAASVDLFFWATRQSDYDRAAAGGPINLTNAQRFLDSWAACSRMLS